MNRSRVNRQMSKMHAYADNKYKKTELQNSTQSEKDPEPNAVKAHQKDKKNNVKQTITGNLFNKPPYIPSVKLEDIGGLKKELVLEANTAIYDHLYSPYYKTPGSMLIHGSRGSGKTMFVQALAGFRGLPVLECETNIFFNSTRPINTILQELFEQANVSAPCVLHLIYDIRSDSRMNEGGVRATKIYDFTSALCDILTEDDSSSPENGRVFVVLETRSLTLVDEKLRQALKHHVAFGLPNQSARLSILEKLSSKYEVSSCVDYKQLAFMTPGFYAGDLENIFIIAQREQVYKTYFAKLSRAYKEKGCVELAFNDILEELQGQVGIKPQTAPAITLEDLVSAIAKIPPNLLEENYASIPKVSMDEVGALAHVKAALQAAILDKVESAGLYEEEEEEVNSSGILLCGPPGTGKTMIAMAVANQAGLNFIPVKGSELLNMYFGESERKIQECFQNARNSAPCVIFFDEIDALCPRRKDDKNEASSRVVAAMLSELSGLNPRQQVYAIGATNNYDAIDPALLRSGRFGIHLYVGLPSPAERTSILEVILLKSGKNLRLAPDVDIPALACNKRCNNFSGSDLRELVLSAFKFCIQSLDKENLKLEDVMMQQAHFLRALQEMKPSIGSVELERYQRLEMKISGKNLRYQMMAEPEQDSISKVGEEIPAKKVKLISPINIEPLAEEMKSEDETIAKNGHVEESVKGAGDDREPMALPDWAGHRTATRLEALATVVCGLRPGATHRGLLVVGPFGSSRAAFVEDLTVHLKTSFIKAKALDLKLTNKPPHKKLQELYDKAKASAPALLFIDNVDDSIDHRNEVFSRALASLIKKEEADLVGSGIVIVIGAEKQSMIDESLRQSLKTKINLGIMDESLRQSILTKMAAGKKLAGDVNLKELAHNTPGFTELNFKHLFEMALKNSIKRSLLGKVQKFLDLSFEEQFSFEKDSEANKTFLEGLEITALDLQEAAKKITPYSMSGSHSSHSVSGITWERVGALGHVKEALQSIIMDQVRYPHIYHHFRMLNSSGILLHGPPGTGKTMVAMAMANECGLNFISVKGPEFLNMYFGESERKIRECFETARSSAPCVVFFDEIDSICGRRSGDADDASSRVVGTLLAEMNGLDPRHRVYVIAATNRLSSIDPAMLRTGRLGTHLYLGLPDITERAAILDAILHHKPGVTCAVDLQAVAERTARFSGADLQELVHHVTALARQAGKHRPTPLTTNHFQHILATMRPSLSMEELNAFKSTTRPSCKRSYEQMSSEEENQPQLN